MLSALSQCVADTRFTDIDAAAIERAQVFLLDSLAIGVAGKRSAYRDGVLSVALKWGEGSTARVWGDERRVPVTTAAFVNTYQMHCLEFDSVHEPAVAHVMTAVAGAALAECEAQLATEPNPVSGQRLLTALVVGVEVATTLGLAAAAPLTFFRPATTGVFGAAAAVASLRGFDVATTQAAFGYALSQAAGTMQAHDEGKPTLPMQLAAASRAGIVSADLAATGIPAPEQALDGKFGYFALFESAVETESELEALASRIASPWRVTELSHKPFPSGRATHGGVAAVLELREQGIKADNVERLELLAPPLIHQLVIRPATTDMNVNYARLCFPYVGAVALLRGGVGLEDFSEQSLRNTEVLALAEKITAVVGDSADPAAFTPQRLRATCRDGRTVSADVEHLPGSPAMPLSPAQYESKVRACVAFVYGDSARAQPLIDAVAALPTATRATDVLAPIT